VLSELLSKSYSDFEPILGEVELFEY